MRGTSQVLHRNSAQGAFHLERPSSVAGKHSAIGIQPNHDLTNLIEEANCCELTANCSNFKDREGDASQLNRLIFFLLTTLALAIARSILPSRG
jgi:hypothetical protein